MRNLRFNGQVYGGVILAIAIIAVTGFSFYNRINKTVHQNQIWMTSSVEALALLDTLVVFNNNITYDAFTAITDSKVSPTRFTRDYTVISGLFRQLSDHLDQMKIGTFASDRIQHIQELRVTRLQEHVSAADIQIRLAEIHNEEQRVNLLLNALKNVILSKRAAQMAIHNQKIVRTKYEALGGLALAIVILLALIRYITITFNLQRKAELLIRKTNDDLNRLSREREADNWILIGLAALEEKIRGGLDGGEIARNAIRAICRYLSATSGFVYLNRPETGDKYTFVGAYSLSDHIPTPASWFKELPDERLRSRKPILLSDLLGDQSLSNPSLGFTPPHTTVIQSFVYEHEILGVMEIRFPHAVNDTILRFLEKASISVAVACKVANTHSTLSRLYEETQRQAKALEIQQAELRAANDELMHKTQLLKASEKELRSQQEVLRRTNAELQEKARLLEERNASIEQARQSLALKAAELEQSDRYKSEFLANVSHELKTPLNSILILAKLLEDNKLNTLSPEEVKYASVIRRAGTDLLGLINNVLDLSKIESGKIDLVIETISLADIRQDLLELFSGIAANKSINFVITTEDHLPSAIVSDGQRLMQILKNLLSNAFKFTDEHGRVSLTITSGDRSPAWTPRILPDIPPQEIIAFAVTDTGIGIPPDKQELIFEAFRQADGSISRKYGGTGLGLSICRELATRLGGTILVNSEEGKGSTFTLFLPLELYHKAELSPGELSVMTHYDATPDLITKRVLIIKNDRLQSDDLASMLSAEGIHSVQAFTAGEAITWLTSRHQFDCIILDINLPDKSGITLLDEIKVDPRHINIPIIIFTTMDLGTDTTRQVLSYDKTMLLKPNQPKTSISREINRFIRQFDNSDDVDTRPVLSQANAESLTSPIELLKGKRILIADDDMRSVFALSTAFAEYHLTIEVAANGAEALEMLHKNRDISLIIMDIMMPEINGFEAIRQIRAVRKFTAIPIIVVTAKSEKTDRQLALEMGANDCISKPIDINKLITSMQQLLAV